MKNYTELNGMIDNQKNVLCVAFDKGYKQGVREGKEEVWNARYEKGLNDAWDALKWCANTPSGIVEDIIGDYGTACIVSHYRPQDVMQKIKEYEEKRMEEKQKEDTEIKIGDEVLNKWGTKGIVIEIAPQHNGATVYSVLWRNAERRCLDKSDWDNYEVWKKTGRHFPEIAEVLRKMKEVEE